MLKGIKEYLQRSLGWRYQISTEDIIESLHEPITDYVNWYAERGLYLPEEYKTDPGAWTDVLRKIQRSFELAHKKDYKKDEVLKKEMQEGFELFGKYFLDLWK
jgi:hypothetical protein